MALYKAGQIPHGEFTKLTRRHAQHFEGNSYADASPLMVNDLKAFADHLEQFGSKTA